MDILNKFQNLKIGKKIGVSFGLLGILFVLVIWQYHTTLTKVESSFEELLIVIEAKEGEENRLIIEERISATKAGSKRSARIALLISLGAILIGVAFAFIITRSIVNPIIHVVEVVKKIARGDLSETVTVNSQDEIGDLAIEISTMVWNLNMMAEAAGKIADGDLSVDLTAKSDRDVLGNAMVTMVKSLREMSEIVKKISHGDLTVDVKPKSDRDVMGNALLKMKTDLTNIVGNILVSAENVASGANEIAAGNQNLSQRSQEQASALEETASTVEQMNSNIKTNAQNAQKANQMAKKASEAAEQGGTVIEKTIHQMEVVTESSKRISEIITAVNEIAFQTNLLALNAAVEAARAGEQGRGFAVVAGEVRNLAGRSAEAAREIQSLIKDSVEKIETGNKLVEDTGMTLGIIIENVKNVANNISEISSASQEQASGIDLVNKTVSQMDEVVQQNASLVEEAAATSENLSSEAENMQKLMGSFKINMSNIEGSKCAQTNRSQKRRNSAFAQTTAAGRKKSSDLSKEFEEF